MTGSVTNALTGKCLGPWTEVRVVVADYNHSRPHGKPGYQSPVRFAAQKQRLASFEAGQTHPTQLHTKRAPG